MMPWSASTPASVTAVLAAYDFSRFRTVADLGGGTGLLLTHILRANEGLGGVPFELPEVAARARRTIEAAGLSARLQVIEGDLFKAALAGCDAYILAHVLHDWSDDRALTILRNCRDAMPRDGRLMIVEAVLPPGDTPHHGKVIDLLMLTVTGGAERTADEYGTLLAAAGFKVMAVHPTATHQSIVEAAPAGPPDRPLAPSLSRPGSLPRYVWPYAGGGAQSISAPEPRSLRSPAAIVSASAQTTHDR
jgi:predicted O-methyltransferase YrrM